ncbi:alpha/beta-type small acid-soluble spore protein [Sporosarcina luteola]|uniref:alpha/beta-type small acid-soluble spore protein n=1 Tax=Bacillales TaxID=1385 RepID=UPI00203A5F25|nr:MULTISPECIES: alpha/beta-type small acid-soluble spore protein [Bacillales]MCM3637485.1 alpha/beta-type small acid-soluble spore protein [Sporosarcina luteola]
MARNNNRIFFPEARKQMDQLKADVMKAKGYTVDNEQPDSVKYEVAKELGIPLSKEYNGKLTSEQAGKIGGPIGGNMVKEMVRLAQEQLAKDKI